MPDLQPLSSEDDILKEAREVPQLQPAPSTTSLPQQESGASYESTTVVPTVPADVRPAIVTYPQEAVPSYNQPTLRTEEIDLKPFHYALPAQNYVVASVLLGAASFWVFLLIQAAIIVAQVKAQYSRYYTTDTNAGSTVTPDQLLSYLGLAVLIVVGLALLSNKRGARLVALIGAGVGVLYWGYQLYKIIEGGGLMLFTGMFAVISFYALAACLLPLGLMVFTIIHLTRPRVAAAYR